MNRPINKNQERCLQTNIWKLQFISLCCKNPPVSTIFNPLRPLQAIAVVASGLIWLPFCALSHHLY